MRSASSGRSAAVCLQRMQPRWAEEQSEAVRQRNRRKKMDARGELSCPALRFYFRPTIRPSNIDRWDGSQQGALTALADGFTKYLEHGPDVKVLLSA
jgi:hypothetical protein